jgi:succinate dehydrogenase/fumarate reductase cytochrome b subunit
MENLSAMRVGGDGAAAYSAASPLQHPEKTFMHETSQLALGAAAVGLAGTWAWRQRLALRPVHRASAIALALFLAAHLLGHLAGLAGAAAHQSVLEALRLIYRQPLVEGVLLGCLLFQMGSGLTLLWRGRGRRRGGVAWMQAISGGYLALFLLIHVTAVLAGRFQGVDTNLQFAAAGMHTPPWQWFFGPYYFFAVFALGTHVGCALYWNLPEPLRARALVGSMLAGWMLAVGLVVLLAGGFHALEIPARYLAPLAGIAGRG